MKIYVLESDSALARTLTLLLREEGHAVEACRRLDDAYGEIARLAPDLLLVGCGALHRLPSDWTARIRLAGAEVPAVLLVSLGRESFRRDNLEGVERLAVVAKPPDWERLRRIVEALG